MLNFSFVQYLLLTEIIRIYRQTYVKSYLQMIDMQINHANVLLPKIKCEYTVIGCNRKVLYMLID